MAAPSKINFKIYQGATFSEILRWESSVKAYAPITGITKAAPMVVTSTAHTIPAGWRVKITNVAGMKEVNSTESYLIATTVQANSVTFNDINSLGYSDYTSGGVLEYNVPIDLTGFTARMQLRNKVEDATILHEMTTENTGIAIDTINKTITLNISAVNTAIFSFASAVYSLELVSSGGIVTPFANGSITLVKEVTR